MPEPLLLTLDVNGESRQVVAAAHDTLLEVLRGPLDLTGAKPACDMGECGCCAVWLDGEPVLSCLILAATVEGREITTVEGLAAGPRPHPLQEAFHAEGAAQCGYCTPGFLMVGAALLARDPHPAEAAVRAALSGNLCRCTGYTRILAAVARAARGGEANGG